MTEIRVDSPEKYFKKGVDDNGRLYLGKEFAGREVQVVIADAEGDEDA